MKGSRKGQREQFPQTIEEAVQLILSRMTDDMKAFLRDFDGDEVELRVALAKGLTAGMSVRAMLGLWGQNPELLAQLPSGYRHPDHASTYLLMECGSWLKDGRA